MWVRKTEYELEVEHRKRRAKANATIMAATPFVAAWVLWEVGSPENLLKIIEQSPEQAFGFIFLPVFIYFGYRNYVLHGNAVTERPGKVCLNCGKGMGFSDDGWGFKVYGKKKREWYQFRACETPEKCNIAYQYEVKWVEEEERNSGVKE